VLFKDSPYPWSDTGEPGVEGQTLWYGVRSTYTVMEDVQIPLQPAARSSKVQLVSSWLAHNLILSGETRDRDWVLLALAIQVRSTSATP
jgi:hypothetical protein